MTTKTGKLLATLAAAGVTPVDPDGDAVAFLGISTSAAGATQPAPLPGDPALVVPTPVNGSGVAGATFSLVADGAGDYDATFDATAFAATRPDSQSFVAQVWLRFGDLKDLQGNPDTAADVSITLEFDFSGTKPPNQNPTLPDGTTSATVKF